MKAVAKKIHDTQFVMDDSNWPKWPVLPLKQINTGSGSSFPELGFLCVGQHRLTVFKGNMYYPASGPTTTELIAGRETVKYDTAEQLLAEWCID